MGRRWLIVGALFLITFSMATPLASYGVFLPILAERFGWSRGAISAALSMNLLVGGVAGFAAGALADRYGPRLILVVTVILAGTAFALVSVVDALWQLYLLVGLVGRGRHVELLPAERDDDRAVVRRPARAGAGPGPRRVQPRLYLRRARWRPGSSTSSAGARPMRSSGAAAAPSRCWPR